MILNRFLRAASLLKLLIESVCRRSHRIRLNTLFVIAGLCVGACNSASDNTTQANSGSTETPPLTGNSRDLEACGSSRAFDGSFQEPVPYYQLPEPEVGQRFADPNFGNCLVRLTDHKNDPTERFARNAYPRRQPFNADGSRVLIQSGDGSWHLYDPVAIEHITAVNGLVGDAEPHWHPTDPDILFYLPEDGVGMRVMARDVLNGTSITAGDLADRLLSRWPSAAIASTRSDGYPSRNMRYWTFLVETAQQIPLGIIVWDSVSDTVIAQRDAGTGPNEIGWDIDWVSMSPSGDYVVVAADGKTIAWTRNLQFHGLVHDGVEHADIAIGADGRDVYVSVDFNSFEGELFMRHLDTLVRTNLYSTFVDAEGTTRFTSLHVSGKSYRRPGWVVVSNYRTRSPRHEWFHRTVLLVELADNPLVQRLATHHSRFAGYWSEPHASPNLDLTRVIFNSNWTSGSDTDIDAWLIDIDDDVVQGTRLP